MHFSISGLIGLLGGWSAFLIAAFAWLSKLANDRLLSEWRRDEQSTLERLRDSLSEDRLLFETALKGFQSGKDANHQKLLAAVERLWAATLGLRSTFSEVVFFFEILLPEEYDVALKGGQLSSIVQKVDDQWIAKAMTSAGQAENDRPYLGETLWLRFYIYRAFLGRLSALITMGKQQGKIKNWKTDSGVRQLLSAVSPNESEENLIPSFPNMAVSRLESLILEEMSVILSGRRSAVESFENAKNLQKRMDEYEQTRGRR